MKERMVLLLLMTIIISTLITIPTRSHACELNSTIKHHHKWHGPTSKRVITVDATGSGDFLSVQEAIDSIPDNNTQRVIIKIKAGVYM